jgi:hypothetical protein
MPLNQAGVQHMLVPVTNAVNFLPRTVVVGETLDWLDKYLGLVNP